MANYQLMYMNVLWPVGVQLMTIVITAVYVRRRKNEGYPEYNYKFFLPGWSGASKSGLVVNQITLGLFSFWDQVNAVFTSLPGPYISITIQSILTNLNVVWTVVISIIYLSSRYTQTHYIGCILIVFSGIISMLVELQTGEGLGTYITATGDVKTTSEMWYIIFILGTVPAGISNCYKEKVLKNFDLEIMYASLWSGYWQILWGLIMFPINWIPMPDPAVRQYPSDTLAYMNNTLTCFFGVAPTEADKSSCEAEGGTAAYWFLWYLLFNCLFNILMLYLTKKMSATWATIGTVLCLDLTSVFGGVRFFMGSETQSVTLEQWVGLGVAGVGFWCYCLENEKGSSCDSNNTKNADDSSDASSEAGCAYPLQPESSSIIKHAACGFATERSSLSINGIWHRETAEKRASNASRLNSDGRAVSYGV